MKKGKKTTIKIGGRTIELKGNSQDEISEITKRLPKGMREDVIQSIEAAKNPKPQQLPAPAPAPAPAQPKKTQAQAKAWYYDEKGKLKPLDERWNIAKERKQKLKENDVQKELEREKDKQMLDAEFQKKEETWNEVNKGNILKLGQAILEELSFGAKYLATHISYVPRDINDGLNMMAADLTIASLAVEKIIEIIGRLIEITEKIWKIIFKLDVAGAFNIVEKYAESVNKALETGIREGILDKDGNLQEGFARFAVPGTSGVNSPEEIRKWLAVKALMRIPIFGNEIQNTLETQMLVDYESRTGVGIPNEEAWIRWILGNSGAYMPVQEASELAGNIPEWWLIGKTSKLSREINDKKRKEIEKQMKDYHNKRERAKLRARTAYTNPWVKR